MHAIGKIYWNMRSMSRAGLRGRARGRQRVWGVAYAAERRPRSRRR